MVIIQASRPRVALSPICVRIVLSATPENGVDYNGIIWKDEKEQQSQFKHTKKNEAAFFHHDGFIIWGNHPHKVVGRNILPSLVNDTCVTLGLTLNTCRGT